MEFTIPKHELLNAVDRVLGAVDKKSTTQILSHLLLTVSKNGSVRLAATDLMIYASTGCEAVVSSGGTAAVPAEKLRGAVDKCGGEIALRLGDNSSLHLDSNGLRYDIACLDGADFPEPFNGNPVPLFSLGHGILPSIVKSLKHAICSDELKFNICGVRLDCKAGRVTACATDGHRLGLAGRDIVGVETSDAAFTIPAKACNILAGINSTVDIAFSPKKNMVHFCDGKTDLLVLLQEGEFPSYRNVIPQYLTKGCTVVISSLIEALEACGVMGDEKNKSVQLSGDDGQLTLTTLGITGKATATIPYLGDDDLELRLNSRYLLQSAKAIDGEELFLKYGDPLSPVMLIPVDHKSWDERIEVIMPLRG